MKTQKKSHDTHRYVIVVPESGHMYLLALDDGIRATARKMLGASYVDVCPCGMDKHYHMVFAQTANGSGYNESASRLAQEHLSGPVIIARGDKPGEMRGVSRGAALRAMEAFQAMVGGDGDV